MINDEKDLSETPSNTTAELILLGHIINNMSLLEQYGSCLQKNDFHDKPNRILYDFLCDYYRNFGTEYSQDKVNILYLKWKSDNKEFSKHFSQAKVFWKNLKTLKKLGSTNALVDNIHYQSVKKASCLRRLKEAGIDTKFIEKSENFSNMTSDEIMRLVSDNVDNISQNCMLHPTIDLVSKIKDTACSFIVKPDFGFQTPFTFINDYIHGLCKNDLTMIGANTNCGKSRLLVYILTYLVCVEKQPVLLLSNELTEEQFQKILICTVVNMPQLSELHDQKIRMTQSEITQPHYYSKDGMPIEILPNEGNKEYINRLKAENNEFAAYLKILEWFQDNYKNMFNFKNISDDYSVERLKMEIRTAKKHGCTVVAYDTLKGYGNADWGELQQTATELSELIKSDPDGITGLATLQLTDDTLNKRPEDLNSTNIANAKHIMHVTDNMLMFKTINNSEFLLEVNSDNKVVGQIPADVKIAAFKIVKNRNGAGKDALFGVQTNLDYNVWNYIGILHRKYEKEIKIS